MARSRRGTESRSKRKRTKQNKNESKKSVSEVEKNDSNHGIFTASNIGRGLFQFGFAWLVIAAVLIGASSKDQNVMYDEKSVLLDTGMPAPMKDTSNSTGLKVSQTIVSNEIKEPLQLAISEDERKKFHPVVIFPYQWVKEEVVISPKPTNDENKRMKKQQRVMKKKFNYTVLDLTTNENHEAVEEKNMKKKSFLRKILSICSKKSQNVFYVGKYDENRIGLYTTDLFQNTTNQIDGYHGQRTIHMGIDLFAPVGHKVYAFADGKVHSAGYNSALGDYGNVVVLEHEVVTVNNGVKTKRKIWALYGHLDGNSIKRKKVGMRIKKGKVVGRMGDVHENGGWPNPHVHFQLSIHPPDTHDMPGVVSEKDREKALEHYPDPRIVLGELY